MKRTRSGSTRTPSSVRSWVPCRRPDVVVEAPAEHGAAEGSGRAGTEANRDEAKVLIVVEWLGSPIARFIPGVARAVAGIGKLARGAGSEIQLEAPNPEQFFSDAAALHIRQLELQIRGL